MEKIVSNKVANLKKKEDHSFLSNNTSMLSQRSSPDTDNED